MRAVLRKVGRRGLAVVAVLGAVVVAGCGGGGAATGAAATGPTGEPRSGGSLTLIMPNEGTNLDPAQLNNVYTHGSAYGNALYGQLFTNDPVTGELLPGMAESIETADGTNYTLKLRPGLEFSDGTPLDAAAVKFNWDRMHDPKTALAVNLSTASSVATTTAVDATTLTFVLARPSAQFGQDIVNSALTFIGSPTALAEGPEAFTANPVGAGPFVLKSWTRGDKMVLARNPTFYDAPRPYLDELVIRTDPDMGRRLQTLQAGEVDAVMGTTDEHNRIATESGLLVTREPLNGTNMLIFNLAKPPFDDLRARQAVFAAVDLEMVNQTVYAGDATVPATLMGEGSPFYDPALTFPTPDKARAQQLFDELAAEGKPVEFTLLTTLAGDANKIAQSFQAQLQAFPGVTVQVESLEQTAWFTRLASNDFGASVYGVLLVDPEPQLGRLVGSDSPSNFGKFNDPETDAAIAVGRTSTDPEARVQAYRTVQQRIIEQLPFIGYARPPVALVSNPDVGGVTFYGGGSPRVDTLWIEPEGS
jgi:peptide/nickel transport system substrate-binding protein